MPCDSGPPPSIAEIERGWRVSHQKERDRADAMAEIACDAVAALRATKTPLKRWPKKLQLWVKEHDARDAETAKMEKAAKRSEEKRKRESETARRIIALLKALGDEDNIDMEPLRDFAHAVGQNAFRGHL